MGMLFKSSLAIIFIGWLAVSSIPAIATGPVSAFGKKLDAVPGRRNETWVLVDAEGVYYGFCSELCGINHSFMPIVVEMVSQERFETWIKQPRKKFERVKKIESSVVAAKRVTIR